MLVLFYAMRVIQKTKGCFMCHSLAWWSPTWIFAALEASLRTGGVQPFGSIGVSVDF